MKKPTGVGALIQQLFRQRGMEGKVQEYQAWEIWDEEVGPQIAAQAQPLRVRDGVLEVRVDHPIWMQQLQLLKPKILARLNQRLGTGVIKDLYLRRGKIEHKTAPGEPQANLAWQQIDLDDGERKLIDAEFHHVADPELRQSLTRLRIRQKKREKALHTLQSDA